MKLDPILFNEFIQLRPLKEIDYEGLYEVASDPKIWEQHPRFDRYKEPVFRELFQERLSSKGALLITNRENKEIMGATNFYDYCKQENSVVIGYTFFAKKFWGTRMNREVKNLMIAHAFQYVSRVLFHVGEENIRSQKAVEKLGAKIIGELSKVSVEGAPRKVLIYTLDAG